MKVSRNALKSLIKECLVEILAEGLRENLNEAVAQPRRASLEERRAGPSPKAKRQPPSESLMSAVREASGGDSILAEVLKDTAATSLPQMLDGDRQMSGGSRGGVEQITHSPEEIFGSDVADKWASLAFGNPRSSKQQGAAPTSRKLSDAELDRPAV